MSNLFGNLSDDPRIQKQALASKCSAARVNLLLFIAFSAINILMPVFGLNSYFLFSASVPYLIVQIGRVYCGMMPPEYYADGYSEMVFADKSFFYISLAIAFLVLGIYAVCWICSKKNHLRWMTISLVLLVFDTLILLLNSGLNSIIDLLFHIWMIVFIWTGINAYHKLKKLPKDDHIIEGEFTEIETEEASESIEGFENLTEKENEEENKELIE